MTRPELGTWQDLKSKYVGLPDEEEILVVDQVGLERNRIQILRWFWSGSLSCIIWILVIDVIWCHSILERFGTCWDVSERVGTWLWYVLSVLLYVIVYQSICGSNWSVHAGLFASGEGLGWQCGAWVSCGPWFQLNRSSGFIGCIEDHLLSLRNHDRYQVWLYVISVCKTTLQ